LREELTSTDTGKIAQVLHYTVRNSLSNTKLLPRLLEANDTLIDDLQLNRLPPHPTACLHILSILKETRQYDKGRRLWRWIVRKEGEWVDASVYGAAIELLAYSGDPLAELEELYTQALKRFPGSFVEYHLSPEAILPDRGQNINLDALPMTLLQGIVTARALHSDWRNAYLGFDTALRLFPDIVPARFFDLLANERPISEAGRIFQLASTAKVRMSPKLLTSLVKKMAEQQVKSASADVQFENVRITLAMLDLMRWQAGAGGAIVGPNISATIKGLSNLILWCPPNMPEQNSRQEFNLAISNCAKDLLETFLPRVTSAKDGISALNSLISLAGLAKDTETIIHALSRITALGQRPDDVTCRCFVNAAGMSGDPKGLWKEAWKTMVDHVHSRGHKLGMREWSTLANSCRYIPEDGAKAFVDEQLIALKADEDTKEYVQGVYAQPPSLPTEPLGQDDAALLSARLIGAVSKTRSDIVTNDTEALLSPRLHQPSLASLTHLRIIYDEMTTDPQQTPSTLPPAIDTSDIAFDEHRFINWCAVNDLLAMAQRHQQRTDEYIDRAIEAGTAVEGAGIDRETRCLQYLEVGGKSLGDDEDNGRTRLEHEDLEGAREAVLKLRGRS
jgi:hypothetical protein